MIEIIISTLEAKNTCTKLDIAIWRNKFYTCNSSYAHLIETNIRIYLHDMNIYIWIYLYDIYIYIYVRIYI